MNLEKYLIAENASILEAIEKININGSRFIFIINNKKEVIGLATDGDIRRAILRKVSLNNNITNAMNKDFFFLNSKEDKIYDPKNYISFIPIIDIRTKRLKDILFLDEQIHQTDYPDIPALIMAGGFGKRLKPLTNDTPKPMLEIAGIPLLEITINYLKSLGINKILISTFHLPEKIVNYFGDGSAFNVEIIYLREDSPSGTAGCLGILPKDYNFESLLIINGDILTRINYPELIDFHRKNKNDLTIATNSYEHKVPYGVIKSKNGKLLGIEEKPTKDYEISAGIYMINKPMIDKFIPKKAKMDMPDLISRILDNKKNIGAFPIHEYWLDIGRKNDFDKAQSELKIYFEND